MTRDELVNIVKLRLGNRSGTNQDINIQAELRLAQQVLESHSFLPWFLLTEVSSTTVTVAEERVQVPVDFLQEYEEGFLYLYSATAKIPWTPLGKEDYESVRVQFPGTGRPQCYTLTGQYFRLFPAPDQTYTLKMIYYQQAPVLVSNIANNWTTWAADLLIAKTAGQMARNFRMAVSTIQLFDLAESQALVNLKDAHYARKSTNRDYIMRDAL